MPEPSLVRRGGFPSTRARRRSAHRLCRPPGSRFDPTRREELLDPVTNADLAVLCGADTWGETALLGGREEARPPTFLALPREISVALPLRAQLSSSRKTRLSTLSWEFSVA